MNLARRIDRHIFIESTKQRRAREARALLWFVVSMWLLMMSPAAAAFGVVSKPVAFALFLAVGFVVALLARKA